MKSFHPNHYGIPVSVYLTLQPVFHTQLFQGMWLLEVGTLALYASCQIGSGLPVTLIFAGYSFFSCFLPYAACFAKVSTIDSGRPEGSLLIFSATS